MSARSEVAPCDGCRFAPRCNVERLVCAAFSMYLAGESPVRWSLALRAPARARYVALLGDKLPTAA